MTKSELLKSAKPILFNAEMVRAILDGRKTVTRRLVKPQPYCNKARDSRCPACTGEVSEACWAHDLEFPKRPYKVGDILYIREAWCRGRINNLPEQYFYKADGSLKFPCKWHPSIHMPKDAARIFLRVTGVGVERLQKCGKVWCIGIEKEGVVTPQSPILYINDDAFHDALREEFQKLWDSTIKKSDLDRYGWEANPWVWVIEFERIKTK